MPEPIEPENPDDAAGEIAALQEVQAEEEDVQAHGIAFGTDPQSTVSAGSYCDITT